MMNMLSMEIKQIANAWKSFAQNTLKTVKRISRNHILELIGCVLMAVFVFVIAFPAAVSADEKGAMRPGKETVRLTISAMQNETRPYGTLPISEEADPHRVMQNIPVTAYSSEVGQTDSTPFITASGTRVRDGIVAANFLPIGTKVRFPELYGKKVFVVEDRMNKRYWHRLDVWMAETPQAKRFGVKRTKVEIFYQ